MSAAKTLVLLVAAAAVASAELTATYRVEFVPSWTQAAYPDGFPAGGEWAPVVAAVHNDDYALFTVGRPATVGLQTLSETGKPPKLAAELAAAGTAVGSVVVGAGPVPATPGSTYAFNITATRPHSLLSVAAMIAPSPDWFGGVAGVQLYDESASGFVRALGALVYAHDAGTDSGTTYNAPNDPTVPRGVVTRHVGAPFYPPPVGELRITLLATHEVPAAKYSVTYRPTWNNVTYPRDFPAGAHWSPVVAAAHTHNYAIFREGVFATPGVRNVAEMGAPPALLAELHAAGADVAAVSAGTAAVAATPGSTYTFTIAVTAEQPLVSLVAMIAPSPDWFGGVDSAQLLGADGVFVDSLTVPLYPHDAGTDSGEYYGAPNHATTPPSVVTRLVNEPFTGLAVGTVEFRRVA